MVTDYGMETIHIEAVVLVSTLGNAKCHAIVLCGYGKHNIHR